ncbi:hypothetical protein N7512_002066 [Penicillium capsulatum]|nr:hypothetical protein N7512_002066 [Penicillium capsulatum]
MCEMPAFRAAVRLEELENEVRQLRSSVSNLPPSVTAVGHDRPPIHEQAERSVPNLPISVTPQPTQPVRSGERPALLSQEFPSLNVPVSTSAERCLGSLHFSPAKIDTLFHLFFNRYHVYFPFLQPAVSPDDYFNRSSLLFWVIVYTAARQYPDDPGLMAALTGPLKGLLWETISNPPHTWYIVQAISLLCMWPFPTSSLSTDITAMLVNISQTIAMQLGLHQPEAIQDFSRIKRKLNNTETSEVIRTWAACYIATQSVFTTEGMALTSSGWTVDRICDEKSPYEVPGFLKQQLLIYRFSARLGNYMSRYVPRPLNPSPTQESLSVLDLLEHEYQDLCRSMGGQLPTENEILLANTGLQLYVFYLLDSSVSTGRKIGLVRAFEIATDLIKKLQELDDATSFMKYCPASFSRATTLAALFILRLEDSSFVDILDGEKGKQAFNTALSLLRRTSMEENDLQGRTFKILTQMWSMQGRSQQSGKDPHLKLRTRLGASLLHDTIWRWRENFGGQASGTQTPHRETTNDLAVNGLLENDTAPPSLDPSGCGADLFFEDVFDGEMLSLLPLDFGDLAFDQAETSAGFNPPPQLP